jgi:hypothetical protein
MPAASRPPRRTPRPGACSRGTCRSWRRPATAAPPRRFERGAALGAHAGERLLDERRVAADEQRAGYELASRLGEGREILPLALAAGDQHGRARQTAKSGDGGADVGALRIVVPLDAAAQAYALEAVRQPLEAAQADRQAAGGHPEAAGERAGSQRVGDVVAAVDLQLVDAQHRHAPAYQRPAAHPVVVIVEAEGEHALARKRHGDGARVMPVQHLHRRPGEDPRFRRAVLVDAGVAIEMILRKVQHRRRVRLERPGSLELVARQLEHPGGGRRGPPQRRLQHRRRDVAGHFGVDSRALQEMPGERSHGGLAVGAGNGKDLRFVLPGKQFDIADHRDALGDRCLDYRVFERQARTDAHQVDAVEQRRSELPGVQFAGEILFPGRCGSRVRRTHPAALALDPARNRQAGVAQAEHQHAPALQRHGRGPGQQREGRLAHHLSLSVDRPNSTSIMVMIQKRTTTWLSFQPSSS